MWTQYVVGSLIKYHISYFFKHHPERLNIYVQITYKGYLSEKKKNNNKPVYTKMMND